MTRRWIRENPAAWDADKARIIGRAAPGIFDTRYAEAREGEIVPGEWWRVVEGERSVGFGWMDVVWGDAEILLATDPEHRTAGVGSFIVERLAVEARERGLRYLYNIVRPTHPDADRLTAWLVERGFVASEDGRLLRRVLK